MVFGITSKNLYLADLKKMPNLNKIDKEKEAELFVLAKNGDKKAKDEFVLRFQRFLHYFAIRISRMFKNHDEMYMDLIQEGNIGLCKFIYERLERINFSSYEKFRFIIFKVVKSAMYSSLNKYKNCSITISQRDYRRMRNYIKEKNLYYSECQEYIPISVAAKRLNLPELEILFLDKLSQQTSLSLERNLSNDPNDINSDSLESVQIIDFQHEKMIESIEMNLAKEHLKRVLPEVKFSPMEHKALFLNYGLSANLEIGDELKMRELELVGGRGAFTLPGRNQWMSNYNVRIIKKLKKAMHYDEI